MKKYDKEFERKFVERLSLKIVSSLSREAANLFNIQQRRVFRTIETDILHFTEGEASAKIAR